jgi:hypothetical protein
MAALASKSFRIVRSLLRLPVPIRAGADFDPVSMNRGKRSPADAKDLSRIHSGLRNTMPGKASGKK